MNTVITICLVGLMVAALIGLYALFRSDADDVRATVADLLYFCAIAIFVVIAVRTSSTVTFMVALIASLLGPLSILALARILTGGRR